MPEYQWKAATASGQIKQGNIQAQDQATAIAQLIAQNLNPITINESSSEQTQNSQTTYTHKTTRAQKGPPNKTDILAITSELSIMLNAGLALDNALRVLIDMTTKPSVKQLLEQILEDVKSGATFSKALTKHQKHFGDFYINMVKSGEASGQMALILQRLVEHITRIKTLRENIISACIYPAILLIVALLSLIGMLGFVVPQFEKLFKDMGDALPAPTKLIMWLGETFQQHGITITIVTIAIAAVTITWLKSQAGQKWWQTKALRLPIIGHLLYQYQMTLFTRSLGTLLASGVPLLGSLDIAIKNVSNQNLREPLSKMPPQVKEGTRITKAMQSTGIFEPLAINLIRVGEETGKIGQMMTELSQVFDKNVETGIKRALTLIEPILILTLGILIAAIIISILLGILSVNDLAG